MTVGPTSSRLMASSLSLISTVVVSRSSLNSCSWDKFCCLGLDNIHDVVKPGKAVVTWVVYTR